MVSSLAQTGQWVSARGCGAGAASLSAGASSQVSKSKRGTCRTYVSRSLVVRLTDDRSPPLAIAAARLRVHSTPSVASYNLGLWTAPPPPAIHHLVLLRAD